MPITINGSGTVTGISAGGLPDGVITRPEMGYAGAILQVVEANYSAGTSTTSSIPRDSTIPQNTEGAELLTVSITPTSASNKLLIVANVPYISISTQGVGTLALFQDSTTNAIAAVACDDSGNDFGRNSSFTHYMTAGTTSATTFKLRYGPATTTMYINRYSGGTNLGGVAFARLVVMEIAT